MAWFKLDDQIAFDGKVVEAGNEAFGAWCRAGAWSSAHLTEGFIPDHVAKTIAPPRVWRKLAEARGGKNSGLVERSDGGWTIHDFLQWNPSAEEVRQTRARGRDRVNSFRKRHVENADKTTPCNGDVTRYKRVCNGDVTRAPSPSPSPVLSGGDLNKVCLTPEGFTGEAQDRRFQSSSGAEPERPKTGPACGPMAPAARFSAEEADALDSLRRQIHASPVLGQQADAIDRVFAYHARNGTSFALLHKGLLAVVENRPEQPAPYLNQILKSDSEEQRLPKGMRAIGDLVAQVTGRIAHAPV